MGFGTGKHHASEKLETTLPAAGSTVAKKRAEIKHGSPKHGSRTGKHHASASEGQRSHKGAPKKTLTSPLKLSKRARNDIASTVAKKHTEKQTRQPKTWLPDRETPCQWRTEKPQRSAEKVPNVSSETFLEKLEAILTEATKKALKKSLTSPLKPFHKSLKRHCHHGCKKHAKSRDDSPKHGSLTRKR